MKSPRIAPPLLTLLLVGSPVLAQTGDWQAVENLPQRSLISVEDLHQVIHDTCRFHGVVDGQLFCEYGPHLVGQSEIAFRQKSTRAVRQEQNSTLIGLAIGASAGAVFGAARDPDPGVGRDGSALVGAGVFGFFGAMIGSARGHFWHGKIIYQNPSDQTRSSESPTDRKPTNDLATADRIAAARSPYTQPEDVSADANAHVILAQFPGRRPGPPFSRGAGYPRSAYPAMWSGRPSGRHALIGAVIGGLLGAAAGAKGNAGGRRRLAFGAVGAGLGAAIGLSVPSYPGAEMYRRGWRDDREEASRSSAGFRPDVSVAEAQSFGKPHKRPIEGQ
ncbi:MAG TPA: hypothetical protein VNX60_11650 [Candidatus Acidoferrum sp.]|nr:hypothetical protein [Candidatus Acidoferrum sp.]